MPGYAQSTTQLWAELLGDGGILLPGDTTMPSVNYNLPTDIPFSPISYRFWSGTHGGSVPVYIRQSTADPHTLLVAGSVQPQSSAVGNMPLQLNVSIQLPPPAVQGALTTFEMRRQGSVYIVKISTAVKESDAEGGGGVASVVQLDGWHEAAHPSWWSTETFRVEAELHDHYRPLAPSNATGAPRTERVLATPRSDTPTESDFSTFTTFVSLQEDDDEALQYTMRPRCNAAVATTCSCAVRLRVRSMSGALPVCTLLSQQRASLSDKAAAIVCAAAGNGIAVGGGGVFEWIAMRGALLVASSGRVERSALISVRAMGGAVDVDAVEVRGCQEDV